MSYGNLYIIATPIGNADDITLRAIKTLKEVDIISCEDTRVTSKLCKMHNINYKGKLLSYHEHNAEKMMPRILKKLQNGLNVGFVADAGTPLISDPGFKLVRTAIEKDIKVKSVPGASAITASISIAGISSDQFLFIGFLPKKASLRQKKLSSLSSINSSIIIFESSARLISTLEELLKMFGERQISILKEITKLHEETFLGSISSVLNNIDKNKIKGEMVIIVEKKTTHKIVEDENKIISMLKKSMKKNSISSASKEIAKKTLLKKDNIYKLALKIKKKKRDD